MLGTADLPGVSAIASAVAESAAQDKIPWSALDYSGQTITSISGSAIGGQGGVDTSQCFPATASALLQPSGNYLSATDSGNFYPMTGNPSSFVQSGDLSAYAKESSVSSKLDASASSLFAPSGDYAFNSALSSYAYSSSLSSYIPTSASSSFMPSGDYQTAGDYAYNSSVSSKLDASASSEFLLVSASSNFFTGVHTDTTLSGNGLAYSALGVVKRELVFDSATMDTQYSGTSAIVSVRSGVYLDASASANYMDASASANYMYASAIQIVADSADATASNVIYLVTGQGQ